jgi:hypothetical protein
LACIDSAAQSRQTFLVQRDREVKRLEIQLRESQTACSDLQRQVMGSVLQILSRF